MFSPFSLSLILSELHQGARGESAQQLENVLGLPAEISKAAFSTVLPNLMVRNEDRLADGKVYGGINPFFHFRKRKRT